MKDEKRARGTVALLFVVLVWSSTYAFTKVGMREVPPLTLALLRCCLASVFLLASVMVRWRWMDVVEAIRADLPLACVLGAVGVTGFYACQNLSVKLSSSGMAAVLMATNPLFILLLAVLVLKEQVRIRGVLGVAFGFVGVLTILLERNPVTQALSGTSMIGNIIAVGGGLSLAVYTIINKGAVERHSPLVVTTLAFLTGSCFLIPLALLEEHPISIADFTFATWTVILYLGVLGSGVSYLLWNYALTTMEAARAGVFQFLSPIGALLIGMVFLHEPLTIWGGLGIALVLLGTFLAR